jgi:4-diphosphocytidyl-2-C-methyl-D-erythritol kinase
LGELPRNQWQAAVTNDFESVVFALHPSIAQLKASLMEQGAWYCSMSGSGSAVFAFFDAPVELVGIEPTYFVHWGRII